MVYFCCIHVTRTILHVGCPMRNKSDENWKVVSMCLQHGTLNAAASRLYYAVFQAVLGYAIAKKGYIHDPGVSAHKSMWAYVSDTPEGKFFGPVFKKLMSLRLTADYEPETPTETNIKSLMGNSGSMRQYFFKLAES